MSNSESQIKSQRKPWRIVLWWSIAVIVATTLGGILLIWRAKSDVETHWAGREVWRHFKVELNEIEFTWESWVLLNFRVSEVKDPQQISDAERLLDELLGPDERSTSWSLRRFDIVRGEPASGETSLELMIDP